MSEHVTPQDIIELALQHAVDQALGSDWLVTHYAAVVGFQRCDENGVVHNEARLFIPEGQPPYTTAGLLAAETDQDTEGSKPHA
jgi:hypothetical protein